VLSIAQSRPGAPDTQVLDAAASEARILITEDRDFGEMVVRQRLRVRGLMLLELDRLSNEKEADLVAEVFSIHADKLAGNLIVFDPRGFRPFPFAGEQQQA
jgi:predicted nuclease of predicted toxin-antitoxin system